MLLILTIVLLLWLGVMCVGIVIFLIFFGVGLEFILDDCLLLLFFPQLHPIIHSLLCSGVFEFEDHIEFLFVHQANRDNLFVCSF